ncbi:MAG: SGNH/GDSL hydrolase family protein [Actinomycetota bacterium]|nr:SGNH/GDSL hydrolase family protein [Actinomycetota bacterium]
MRRFVAGMAVALGAVTMMSPVATATTPLDYVALGDSFAAGPLIPNQDINLACLRSNNNYPAVAAKALGARLTDVSCSGATVDDFTTRQFGFVPPQFNALNADTDLVSVTIGGNDVSLVAHALTCINLLPDPIGFSCADRLTAGGKDTIGTAIDQFAPKFGRTLDEIGARAPNAKIVVVGYGTYLRKGGCYPIQPIWTRDANYIQTSVDRLSTALRAQATSRGATFVDLVPVTVGHDTCAAPQDRYLEGLVPTSVAAPLHPNAKGMAAFGAALVAAV